MWKSLEFCVVYQRLVSERAFGIKYDSNCYTRIKLFITAITITYYHFRDHVLTFISVTTFLYFLIQVGRKEHGHNYSMLELPLMCLLSNASV